jgi:ABC-type transporter Mla subunit MlaD
MKELQAATDMLRRVLEVIESTDPDSDSFLDSGADSIDLLLELDEDIRDLLLDIEGEYPKRSKQKFDISRSRDDL